MRLVPVERVEAISKEAFVRDHAEPGRPAVLAGVTRSWRARSAWSVDYLKRVAGGNHVPLYGSSPPDGRRHQHEPSTYMRFDEYLDRLRAGESDLRIFFLNVPTALPELSSDFAFPDIGLKLFERLAVLFVGGRGARVQMHFDIDLADVLLCHFGGPKRVILFGPEQTPLLYRVPFSFSAVFGVQPDAPDYERFPALRYARGEIADLRHGDALFIPGGYWHYVVYDDIGFSLSLRALPRSPLRRLAMLYNIVVLRTVEGVMRRLLGPRWTARTERLAIARTHARLASSALGASVIDACGSSGGVDRFAADRRLDSRGDEWNSQRPRRT